MPGREVGILPAERRRPLLRTAAAEFAESGYEGASLNRIIRSVGMSKSSFYHYFPSKEALFETVIADIGAALALDLAPPSPEELSYGDFWDILAGLSQRLAALGADDPAFRAYAKLFYLRDAPGGVFSEAASAVDDWIDGVLAVGRNLGAVSDALPISLQRKLLHAVLWAMDEWSVEHLEQFDSAELERLAEAQVEAVRRLLGP